MCPPPSRVTLHVIPRALSAAPTPDVTSAEACSFNTLREFLLRLTYMGLDRLHQIVPCAGGTWRRPVHTGKLAAMIEFVRGFRPLLDPATQRRLMLSAVVAILVAGIEALGLVLVVPLVQVITQADTGVISPSAHWVAERLSEPSPLSVAAVLGAVVFGAFVLKAVAALLYLRWNVGFVLESEAGTAKRLLRAYLLAPYSFHLERNSADLQRAVHDDVRRIYEDGLIALIGGAADAVLIVAVGVVLLVVEPLAALGSLVYFSVVAIGYQRLIHGRARAAGQQIQGRVGDAYRVVQQSVGAVKEIQMRHREGVFVEELYQIKLAIARAA